MVARVLVPSLGLAVAIVCSGCVPADAATVEPTASIPDEPSAELATQPVVDTVDGPISDDGFVVTLGSRCSDTWRAAVMRDGGVRSDGPEPGRFDVPNASTRELKMRPGDSLLLTSPHGGIMALQFDNLTAGFDARVEVTEACSGVKRSVVPR